MSCLSHVVISHLLNERLRAPFLDWFDFEGYYLHAEARGPFSFHLDEAPMIEHCRRLFDVAIPQLKPASTVDLLQFLKDRDSVRTLHKAIDDALDAGRKIDKENLILNKLGVPVLCC